MRYADITTDPLCTALPLWLELGGATLWDADTGFIDIDSVQIQTWLDVVVGFAVVPPAAGTPIGNSGLEARTLRVSDMETKPSVKPVLWSY